MKRLVIDADMDAAIMESYKSQFEVLAAGPDSIEIDMRAVTFMDSSGVGGVVFLFKRLKVRSLTLQLINVQGQPLRLLRQLQLDFLIGQSSDRAVA